MFRNNSHKVTILALVLATGCTTVAVTGRTQLNVVSDNELIAAANTNFSQIVSTATNKNAIVKPSDSAEAKVTIETVNRVANQIIDASGLRSKANWEVVILKSSVPNAMVLPNGKIIVFTGIIPIAKNEAGLAAILGHEVAHVAAKHSAERVSQVVLAKAVVNAAAAAADARSNKNAPAISAALGLGAQYGVLMPFSRLHESEADRIGQLYMAKAGYDPAEAVLLWQRMQEKAGASKYEFLSSHPSSETRQEQLAQWLPQAKMYFVDTKKPLPESIASLEHDAAKKDLADVAYPTALQPNIIEGYWYEAREVESGAQRRYEYKKFGDCSGSKCITIISSENASRTITTDFKLVRGVTKEGKTFDFSPPISMLRFPLTVGNKWEEQTKVTNERGKQMKITVRSEVVGYESIDVPAGTFMAYKVTTTAQGRKMQDGWFVPAVRGYAKTISYQSDGSEKTALLTAFQASNDPTGEIERGLAQASD